MPHPLRHVFWTIGFLAVAAAAGAVVRSRAARRRLVFSLGILVCALLVHAAIVEFPSLVLLQTHGQDIENIIVTLGVIYALIALAFNPWFSEKEGHGTPAIVQDALVAVLTLVASLFVFQNSSFFVGLTGSAIVVGLAVQETLGNAFAGLGIQIERPFRVGHWIGVADFEGRVVEVTWRATKLRTKAGNLVIIPNSKIAGEPINNYSEPALPTRLHIEVGASYGTPPNEVQDALLTAVKRVSMALNSPPPDVILADFGASAIVYHLRFWTDNFEISSRIQGAVRSAVYYEFLRRDIEIPWPIQVEYSRHELPKDTPQVREAFAITIASIPVFAALPGEAHGALALGAHERLYAHGEAIVREGEAGSSMFIVRQGRVSITVGADHREVAVTEAGGYFGEMSLLTGDPRTATVSAKGDCRVLEIAAADFRDYVQSHPAVIDQLAHAAATRRRELDQTRAASGTTAAQETLSLAQRMRRFFGLT